jgi:hypothetical protein
LARADSAGPSNTNSHLIAAESKTGPPVPAALPELRDVVEADPREFPVEALNSVTVTVSSGSVPTFKSRHVTELVPPP